jgi:hypothetical protein
MAGQADTFVPPDEALIAALTTPPADILQQQNVRLSAFLRDHGALGGTARAPRHC